MGWLVCCFFFGLRKHNDRLGRFLWGHQKAMPVNLVLFNVNPEKDCTKCINFQWKGAWPFTATPPVLSKETNPSIAKRLSTATASITQRGEKKWIISNFKKWTDAKSQNIHLFSIIICSSAKLTESMNWLLKPMQTNAIVLTSMFLCLVCYAL